MSNRNFCTLFVIAIFIFLIGSCKTENFNELEKSQDQSPEISFLIGDDGPASKPTRLFEEVTSTNGDTGEMTTKFFCVLPGKSCDIGGIVGGPTEEIDQDLINERKSQLSQLVAPDAIDLKNFFIANQLAPLFPVVYDDEIFNKILNDELKLSYDQKALVIIDLTGAPVFVYKLD